MRNKISQDQKDSLLKKIPQKEMESLVQEYLNYSSKYAYFRYIIFGIVAVMVGYNFFVSAKNLAIDEYNIVRNVMVCIMAVFVILLLVLAGVFFRTLRKLKKEINNKADKYGIEKKALRKEFHLFVKTNIGGPGLR